MIPPSKQLLMLVLGVSALVGVSALAVGVMALMQARASWVMFGFEAVVLTAAVIGVLTGRGKFNEGPALGIACVAGTILIGTVFGYLGGGRVLFSIDVRPLVYARAAAALVLGGAAAWIVLSRDLKATLPPFIRGVAFGLPIPLLLLALWKFRAKVTGMSDVVQLGVAIVGFALMTGLLAASVQYLAKAFDVGIRRAEEAPAA